MGLLESLPVQRVRPVLALPLFLGTLRDRSGYGNHGTNTGGNWGTSGQFDGFLNGEINLTADASLNPTDLTIFAWGDIAVQSAAQNQYFATTTDVETRFYMTGSTFIFKTNAVFSSIATTTARLGSAAVTSTAVSAKPSYYVDGSFIGLGSLAQELLIGEKPWNVAGFTANAFTAPLAGLMFFPAVLTPAEIALLHTWSQGRFTPRKQWYGGGIGGTARFLDNFQTARITLADETSGLLSNTSLTINTGTWSMAEDAIGRYALCVANGQLQYNLVGASGFTTDSFEETGSAALTLNANNFQVDALAGDIIRTIRIVA